MKLMIVDNQVATRDLTRELIGRYADEVLECTDGTQAASQCAQFHPDVVTMDLDMPLTGSLEATRQVLSRHPAARVTVIKETGTRSVDSSLPRGRACHFFAKDNLTALFRHLQNQTHQSV
jgi:two-component system, chemotaxis family, protein-glutamate methylesterase/glutaminase